MVTRSMPHNNDAMGQNTGSPEPIRPRTSPSSKVAVGLGVLVGGGMTFIGWRMEDASVVLTNPQNGTAQTISTAPVWALPVEVAGMLIITATVVGAAIKYFQRRSEYGTESDK